eukprot:1188575-Prorocentrum_minimum.AAC.3
MSAGESSLSSSPAPSTHISPFFTVVAKTPRLTDCQTCGQAALPIGRSSWRVHAQLTWMSFSRMIRLNENK